MLPSSLDSIFVALRKGRTPQIRAYALSLALEGFHRGLSNVVAGTARALIEAGMEPEQALREAIRSSIEVLVTGMGEVTVAQANAITSAMNSISGMINNALGVATTITSYQLERDMMNHRNTLLEGSAEAELATARTREELALLAAEHASTVAEISALAPTATGYEIRTDSPFTVVGGATAAPTWVYMLGATALIGALAGGVYLITR